MPIPRNWKEEGQIRWLHDGEPISEEVLNRPLKDLFGNIAFLYDRFLTLFPTVVVEHREFSDRLIADAEIKGGFTKLPVFWNSIPYSLRPYDLYVVGEKIKVGGRWVEVRYIDEKEGSADIWVEDRIIAFKDDVIEGGELISSEMVYVPRMKIPRHSLWPEQEFPPFDIWVGGFLVDKYENSVSSDIIDRKEEYWRQPFSQKGKIPLKVSFERAKDLATRRVIAGYSCSLMGLRHFAEILMICKFLGYPFRGNNKWGRFSGDDDVLENYGISRDYDTSYRINSCLTGTGKNWTHNGSADGIWDLWGNLREWIDAEIEAGLYVHKKYFWIYDASQTHLYVQLETPWAWPLSGVVIVKTLDQEFELEYVNIEAVGVDLYAMQLASPPPSVLLQGAIGYQISRYCVIPDGTRAVVNSLTSEDSTAIIEVLKDTVYTTRAVPFEANDFLIVRGTTGNTEADEVMQINSVQEETLRYLLTVRRGINGVYVDCVGKPFAVFSRTLATRPDYSYQFG
ncbi:MAG: hypothetical protein QXI58_03570, partial [Candidatus Micrarchaeia archaeon]